QRHAPIAWSYDLLEPAEQALFQMASVFAGGFSVPSATAVCERDELSVLDGIGSLVARSRGRCERRSAKTRWSDWRTVVTKRVRGSAARPGFWPSPRAPDLGPRIRMPPS